MDKDEGNLMIKAGFSEKGKPLLRSSPDQAMVAG
jgi:hypothetical protein